MYLDRAFCNYDKKHAETSKGGVRENNRRMSLTISETMYNRLKDVSELAAGMNPSAFASLIIGEYLIKHYDEYNEVPYWADAKLHDANGNEYQIIKTYYGFW